MGSGAGSSAPTMVTAPSGIFAGTAALPVAGVASLSAVSFQIAGNRAGQFAGSFLHGLLPISGMLRLKGNAGTGPETLAAVPLFFTVHLFASGAASRGFGRGGYLPASFAPYLDVDFDEWAGSAYVPASWGKNVYTYHIAGGMGASVAFFYNYTSATGSDARTPGGLGQLTLVSPIRIATNLPGTGSLLVVFGALTLSFVPEPGTLLLLGAGVAVLGLLGRRRLHR